MATLVHKIFLPSINKWTPVCFRMLLLLIFSLTTLIISGGIINDEKWEIESQKDKGLIHEHQYLENSDYYKKADSISVVDKELVKSYINRQFENLMMTEIGYSAVSYADKDELFPPKDKLSFSKVQELVDSFEITNDHMYLFRIGMLYNRLNRKTLGKHYLKLAEKGFEEQLKKNHDDLTTIKNLSLVYLVLQDYDMSLECIDKYLALNAADTILLDLKGFVLIGNLDFDKTILFADSLLVLYPQYCSFYLIKTSALSSKIWTVYSDKDTATPDISFLDIAMEKYMDHIEIQISCASQKLLITYYEILRATKNSIDIPDSWLNMKFIITKEDSVKLNQLEHTFSSLLTDLEFKYARMVYYSLGTIELLKGNNQKAIDYLKKSIRIAKNKNHQKELDISGIYDNLIVCKQILGKNSSAKKWTKKKIKHHEHFAPQAKGYVFLARLELQKGKIDKGEKLLEKALALDSGICAPYVDLANIYMIQDSLDKAELYLNQCYKIKSSYSDLYSSLMLCCLLKGDENTALYLLNQILIKNPNSSWAHDLKEDLFTDKQHY